MGKGTMQRDRPSLEIAAMVLYLMDLYLDGRITDQRRQHWRALSPEEREKYRREAAEIMEGEDG